jgi:hypothetical protein
MAHGRGQNSRYDQTTYICIIRSFKNILILEKNISFVNFELYNLVNNDNKKK